jgi:hypothetical protein
MAMSRTALTFACLVVSLASPLRAQKPSNQESSDSAKVMVLDHDFTGVYEFARIFLQSGEVYRAELSSEDVTLFIQGLPGRPTRPPRIYAFLKSDSPSGASIVEVYPDEDAEYEIRPIAVTGGGVATRLRLYRDVRASKRRQYVLSNPGWEIGVELASGWHSAYPQSQTALPAGSADPQAGTDVDLCFSARTPPGKQGFGWCVLGLGYQTQHQDPTILWIFTEPRVRILGHSRAHESSWELGALLRFGVGLISASSQSPRVLGPGVYLARHIRSSSRGSLSLQLAYTRAFYQGFAKGGFGIFPPPQGISPKSHRVSFGVGWYK